MRNKILLFSLLVGFSFQSVNAGVVPGTIQTSTVTANVSCGTSYNYYAPTNGYCDSWTKTAKVGSWDYLYDYSDSSGNGGYYAPGSGFTAIDAGQTCSWESKGTSHTPHQTTNFNCTFGSGTGTTYDSNSYESGGYDGMCTPKKGVDNLITSFNQIGGVSRTSSLTTSACKVQGRYAKTDNDAPISTVNSVSKVFLNKDTIWCNIEKYQASGYDKKLHPGCAEYAKQNTNISGNQDLLKGLDIKIDNDVSGIWKVEVKLGTCSATYSSTVTDAGILQSTSSANGVKPEYTNGFVIDYDNSFTAFGVTQPSLLMKFGKTRLDGCLGNGKNNLVVTTYDMSRGADGVTLAGNSKTFTTPGIFIDNNTSILEKTGDLSKDAFTDPDLWRNFSLEGNIKVGEDVADKSIGECTLNTSSGSCGAPNVGNVWVAPLGVNPTTGEFTQFTCDGLTFPTTSECVQQPLPSVPKICTGSVPSNALLSNTGGLIVDTPWQNTDSTARCYYEVPVVYCTAGGTVPCVVKPGGPIVTPGVSGVCGTTDGSTVSAAPTSGLCSAGTATIVNGTGPWSWNCLGSGGGNDVSCQANKTQNACASSIYEGVINWPQTSYQHGDSGLTEVTSPKFCEKYYKCNDGTWEFVSDSCTVTNGACGPANGTSVSSIPTTGLCSDGTASSVTGSGPWNWTCNGTGLGTNASCSANKTVASCPSYSRTWNFPNDNPTLTLASTPVGSSDSAWLSTPPSNNGCKGAGYISHLECELVGTCKSDLTWDITTSDCNCLMD